MYRYTIKKLIGVTLLLLISCLQGCYSVRVSSANFDPATNYQKKRVDSFFWGAVQKRTNAIDVVTSNCDSLHYDRIAKVVRTPVGLDEVLVTTNFGYALITVASLGIYCPVQIKWKCAKPCTSIGSIP